MPASQAKTIFRTSLAETETAGTAWPLEAALEAATWAWASSRLASLPKNFSRNTEMRKLTTAAMPMPAMLARYPPLGVMSISAMMLPGEAAAARPPPRAERVKMPTMLPIMGPRMTMGFMRT